METKQNNFVSELLKDKNNPIDREVFLVGVDAGKPNVKFAYIDQTPPTTNIQTITESCVNGDRMKEYFIANHAEDLNTILQSKLGEYADITVNTIANEDGGDIELALGVFDLRDELVSFSQEVADRINNDTDYEFNDLTKEEIEKTITQFINFNSLNIDIDWEEQSKFIHLFYNNSIYTNMDIYDETQRYYYIVLDELYNTVCEFLDSTINQAIKSFNEAWVYEYSNYEDDDL